jgi:hypothetical protein
MTGAATSGEGHHDTQGQSSKHLGGDILLAAICFGPPVAFLAWVGVRYFDWTVLLIPAVAVVGAIGVRSLANEFPSRWPLEKASSADTPRADTPRADTPRAPISASKEPPAKRARIYAAFDSILASVFVASIILVFSHIGRHAPGEHGILPIGVQAVLASIVIGGIGLLLFQRLIARVRSRNERFK